jgi:hypothetical protein
MPLSSFLHAGLDQAISFRKRSDHAYLLALRTSLIILACLTFGCGEASRGTNANSPAPSNQNTGSSVNRPGAAAGSQFSAIDIKEPDRYGVAMTISIQETSEAPTSMLTQQFHVARLDADRRWSFLLPAPLGQVVYLEKSGLRYLVLFDRKQYTEIGPNAFGFEPVKVFTPQSIAERLRSHQFEKLGLEPVNGRTATKYRATAPGDTSTHMIFVDQETGLPLRLELSGMTQSGVKARVIFEARDVQLNPDRAQFDVPAGMKKVAEQDARQQIEAVAMALRPFADTIAGTKSTPVTVVMPPANSNSVAAKGKQAQPALR